MTDDPLKAAWKPGAWTPTRCAHWRSLEPEARPKFEAWVSAERERGYAHERELP